MNDKIKYPRTPHLPYSPNRTDDDKTLDTDEQFKGMTVVVTEKMDGENTTIYPDGTLHARSLDGTNHPWQDWVKGDIQNWCYFIPGGWRVCGENLQAKHSIGYEFPSKHNAFQCFGIYNERNECIAYPDVIDFCQEHDIEMPFIIYCGTYNKEQILSMFKKYCDFIKRDVEGFVVRNINSFPYSEFDKNVAKYVRSNHIQTDEHWTRNWTNNKIVK